MCNKDSQCKNGIVDGLFGEGDCDHCMTNDFNEIEKQELLNEKLGWDHQDEQSSIDEEFNLPLNRQYEPRSRIFRKTNRRVSE